MPTGVVWIFDRLVAYNTNFGGQPKHATLTACSGQMDCKGQVPALGSEEGDLFAFAFHS